MSDEDNPLSSGCLYDRWVAHHHRREEEAYDRQRIPDLLRGFDGGLELLLSGEWRNTVRALLDRNDVDWIALGRDLESARRYRGEELYRCGGGCAALFKFEELRRSPWPGNGKPLCRRCMEKAGKREKTRLARRGIASALARARADGLPAQLTQEQWDRTLAHFDNRCAYCGRCWYVVEHVVSLDLGGGTTVWNCVPACYSCNSIKGERTIQALLKPCDSGDLPHGLSRKRLKAIQQWLDQQDDISW